MRPPRTHEADLDVVVLLIVLYALIAYFVIFNGIAPSVDPPPSETYIHH